MEKIKNLEIIIEENNIWEVTLEELAQMAVEYASKSISYEKTEKGEILIGILTRTGERMFNDGTFLSKTIIVSVLYSRVQEYKTWLTYDHSHKIVKYADYNGEDETHRYETTYMFPITQYPHFLIKKVVPYILKKMEEK
ncbi:MAG: hypothetical protein NTZ84_03525 [Candidatus Nealsonbacteria bacterium]|nr:hypothetical protein [Candidatus Nealsonbacteria bacterium]